MPPMQVAPVSRLEPAQWLCDSITEFGGRIEQLMPSGYDSYVRVFHRPDQGQPDNDSAKTWAQVADRRGTVFHPEAQWTALTGGSQGSPHHDGETAATDEPITGSIDPITLHSLSRVLAAHTTTPQQCHFALWEGHGSSPRAWDHAPRFSLPARRHWLFAPVPVVDVPACSVELEVAGAEEQSRQPGGIGGLHVIGRPKQPQDSIDWVRWTRARGFVQSPSWWWPEDRAWLVHTEVDYDSTLVAGSPRLLRAMLADPLIECLQVTAMTSLMVNADQINTRT